MTDIRAAYERIGADFDDAASRFGSPALVERFAGMFVQDKSFDELEKALAAHDARAAFRAVHTLKGVAQNLGFDGLYRAAFALTGEMRGGKPLTDAALYDAVPRQQQIVLDAVRQLA